MRGEAHFFTQIVIGYRITPAHAGRSSLTFNSAAISAGSPPRMRGEVWAEKEQKLKYKDHPRACGEKAFPQGFFVDHLGSPPRMRGEALKGLVRAERCGITPAHAGRRRCDRKSASFSRDHPRACGEKASLRSAEAQSEGSPPRMRGEASALAQTARQARITPAHAGRSGQCVSYCD